MGELLFGTTEGHRGARRTPFDPRRVAKDREELQLQHLLSAKGREGARRTATATPFIHEGPQRATENCNCNTFCPRRGAKNCNCNTFYPRRATKGHGELQLQHLLSAKGREGSRRTATATPFIHGGPQRATENCNCNTFCPRRGAKGHEELQLQHLFVHEGPLRATKDHEEHLSRRRATTGGGGTEGGDRCGCGEAWFWRGALRGRSPCTREAACGRPPKKKARREKRGVRGEI